MKYIYGMCLLIGLLLTIGFAGGSDCGALTLGQAVWYSIGGLLVSFIGVAGLKDLEEREGE